ncbi:hypothetical protein H4R18_004227, partial [Coemansia javaensis]
MYSPAPAQPPAELAMSAAEQPILDALIAIRNRLAALKRDRGNYYRPNDIVGLYRELLEQASLLQSVRASEHHDNDAYKNRLDSVLDECFQLFSLFYLALGKNKEVPATYVHLVTVKQNFELMRDTGIYTDDDLEPFVVRLREIRQLIEAEAAQ